MWNRSNLKAFADSYQAISKHDLVSQNTRLQQNAVQGSVKYTTLRSGNVPTKKRRSEFIRITKQIELRKFRYKNVCRTSLPSLGRVAVRVGNTSKQVITALCHGPDRRANGTRILLFIVSWYFYAGS